MTETPGGGTSGEERLASLIRKANSILVFTGAGISTASGIPDYRGPKGLWTHQQPVDYRDFMTREDARVEYWTQKLDGWEEFRDAAPNAVHEACVRLVGAHKLCMVVTQNIDGLHQAAGLEREKLVELHGTMRKVECQSCHAFTDPEPHYARFRETRKAPLCECGGYQKPATISFGQGLRHGDLRRAFSAAEMADLALALGSTLSVQPACSVPLLVFQRGYPYAIVNRGETDHDSIRGVLRLEGDVVEIFPAAVLRALEDD